MVWGKKMDTVTTAIPAMDTMATDKTTSTLAMATAMATATATATAAAS